MKTSERSTVLGYKNLGVQQDLTGEASSQTPPLNVGFFGVPVKGKGWQSELVTMATL